MQISIRTLTKHSVFAKCADCNAPVYEDLIPKKRFKEAISGRNWTCSNPDCLDKNDSTNVRCQRCLSYREAHTLPRDNMFIRYREGFNDPAIGIFKKLLVYLPLIGIH